LFFELYYNEGGNNNGTKETKMKKPIEVMVACGSGIATSTVAANEIQEIFDELDLRVNITKGTIIDIPSKEKDMDIIFVTNNYREETHCPVINVTSFITGIRKEQTKNKIKQTVMEICGE
jgi:PTS system galactitol-specific IIB component